MNNEKKRGGGGEKNGNGDRRRRRWRRREWGSVVHLTGGGVPPLDLSCFVALTAVALTPPSYPASFSLSMFLSFFFCSLPPSSVSFSPAVVCQPQQHALFRTHDLTESGEKRGALITARHWRIHEVQKEGLSDWCIISRLGFHTFPLFSSLFSSCATAADESHPLQFLAPIIPSKSHFFYWVSHCEGMSSV